MPILLSINDHIQGREGILNECVDSDISPRGPDSDSDSDDATASIGQKRKSSRRASSMKKRKRVLAKSEWADAVPSHKSKRSEAQKVNENDVCDKTRRYAETLLKMKSLDEQGQLVVTPNWNKNETMADHVSRLALAMLSRDAVKQFVLEDGDPTYMFLAQRGKQTNETGKGIDYDQICNRNDQLQFAKSYQALRDERQFDRLVHVD
ncbi:uncharacterized protein FMAN_15450 [Fusarium mangiferae]|uniref:Uncharacterized protein n=1 Tax=Fusarium mangiferae TaxID=192010 RepID=A0A1L7UM71_FUSMA|nr:uncharacterized protein FMAN_15450 [Fusarium mangiferae]CVL09195.1 uncharacterized protein FMAN_15450 [Fusarium mangiferae]